MKIVADTNVLVSALIFPGGAPETVYRMALAARIELASSRPPLAELGRVLTDKFGWDAGRAEDAVSQVVRIASVVEPVEAVSKVHEDPDDNRVLEAAAEARADRDRVRRPPPSPLGIVARHSDRNSRWICRPARATHRAPLAAGDWNPRPLAAMCAACSRRCREQSEAER
jgi:uncharacterized protein